MGLITSKSIIVKQGAVIEFNEFEEIKQQITEYVSKYNNYQMTDDTYKETKGIRSQLNKDKEVLEDLRKQVKKEVMKPYLYLETQTKELVSIINEVSGNIESQLQEYDLKEKEDKRDAIDNYFNKLIVQHQIDFIGLFQVFNDKWLNKGYKLSKIEDELDILFINISNDLKVINLNVNGARIKSVYLQNGYELAAAIESVMQSIANEKRQQAIIDEELNQKGLIVEDEEIQEIKSTVTIEKDVVSQVKIMSMKFEIVGDVEILKDIVAYIRSKDVKLNKL